MKELTKLRHTMMRLRGAYMQNVRAGRCELDKQVLKEFDANMERVNGRQRKAVPAGR
jgi:hypothetical protein